MSEAEDQPLKTGEVFVVYDEDKKMIEELKNYLSPKNDVETFEKAFRGVLVSKMIVDLKRGKFGFSLIMKRKIEEAVGDFISEQDMLKTLVEVYSSFYRVVLIMNCMTVAAICFDIYF